jgi:hypothetical protein
MLGSKGKKVPQQLFPDITSFAGPKATKHWMTMNRKAVKFQGKQHLASRELKKAILFTFCLLLEQKIYYYELIFSSTPMAVSPQKVTLILEMERIGSKPGFHMILKGESPPPSTQQVEKHGIHWDANLQFKYRVPLNDHEKLWWFIKWVLKTYDKKINKETNLENKVLTWAMYLYQNRKGTTTSCSLSDTTPASSSFPDCQWLEDMKSVFALLMRRYAD